MSTSDVQPYQADTPQLLDLMIHSLYSHKEVFLRELISNASDALERRRFESLTNHDYLEDTRELAIHLTADPKARTLTVSDNGIGMSRDELIRYVGTIARSGTKEAINKLKESPQGLTPELIGQFGLGFYASFMVADKIQLVTRRAGETTATRWESRGKEGFQISDTAKDGCGTTITLYLSPVDVDNGIEDFTNEHVLRSIVKRYSDFVTFPIKLQVMRKGDQQERGGIDDEKPAGEVSGEALVELETLNSMKAIWTRRRSEVSDEEYEEFYRHISHDSNKPLRTIVQHAEGTVEYQSLLFLPSQAPYDLYYQAYEGGLQLYVKKVKVIEKCTELLPRYLRFVKGIVECSDLPLNVSRELLQQTRVILAIRRILTREVLKTLTELMQEDADAYLSFWKEFGRAIKEGATSDFSNRETIHKLLLFYSSNDEKKMTTLDDYVGRMKVDQKEIYFVTGESRVVVENLPHLEALRARDYEVLYLIEPVDELLVQHLTEYDGKKLKSAGKGTIDLADDANSSEAQAQQEKETSQYSELLEFIQKTLNAHVKQVRPSSRLTTSAACLVGAEHDYSPQLERLLLKGEGGGPKQRRILEINLKHPVFQKMRNQFAVNADNPALVECIELLHGQALLSEGLPLHDPVKFSRQVVELMARTIE